MKGFLEFFRQNIDQTLLYQFVLINAIQIQVIPLLDDSIQTLPSIEHGGYLLFEFKKIELLKRVKTTVKPKVTSYRDIRYIQIDSSTVESSDYIRGSNRLMLTLSSEMKLDVKFVEFHSSIISGYIYFGQEAYFNPHKDIIEFMQILKTDYENYFHGGDAILRFDGFGTRMVPIGEGVKKIEKSRAGDLRIIINGFTIPTYKREWEYLKVKDGYDNRRKRFMYRTAEEDLINDAIYESAKISPNWKLFDLDMLKLKVSVTYRDCQLFKFEEV